MPMLYHSEPEIMSGVPVFAGTRVPIAALIDYLIAGRRLAEFLEHFPSVKHEQAVGLLKIACAKLLASAPQRAPQV